MNTNTLAVTLCQTRDGRPLACVDLPGIGTELTPAELRAIAAGLVKIAAQPMTAKHYMRKRRDYPLNSA